MKLFFLYGHAGKYPGSWLSRPGSGLGWLAVIKGFWYASGQEKCSKCHAAHKASHIVILVGGENYEKGYKLF